MDDTVDKTKQQLLALLEDIKAAKGEEAEKPALQSPREIKSFLDEYVISQAAAKRQISVAVYKHLLRRKLIREKSPTVPQKSNVLLIGPTGCGKTFILQTLSKQFDLPFAIMDMSQITQSGYIGGKLTDISSTLERVSKNRSDAEFGVVLLDEIDKLSSRGDHTNNIGHISIQQELLKVLEGTELGGLNTENILFVAAGAFLGEVHEDRTEVSKTMGFGGASTEVKVPINDQLVEFGLLPELIGRFQIGAELKPLSQPDLITIMTKAKGSILKNLIEVFQVEGIKIHFTKGALEAVANIAIEKGTGARALNSVLEATLRDLQYECFGSGGKKADIRISKSDIKQY